MEFLGLPIVRAARSFLVGLLVGAVALTSWIISIRTEPEMGRFGTFLIFALFLSLWYIGFFFALALPTYRFIVSRYQSIRPSLAALLGAALFSIASVAVAYLNDERSFPNFCFLAGMAAISGSAAFFSFFKVAGGQHV